MKIECEKKKAKIFRVGKLYTWDLGSDQNRVYLIREFPSGEVYGISQGNRIFKAKDQDPNNYTEVPKHCKVTLQEPS